MSRQFFLHLNFVREELENASEDLAAAYPAPDLVPVALAPVTVRVNENATPTS